MSSQVSFTESLIDSGIAIVLDSIDKKAAFFDDAIKYLLVFFGEGMFMRAWIRVKIEGLQTEKIIKDISASAISKMGGLSIYNYFTGDPLNFSVVKKSVMVAIGTGVFRNFFSF